jgi:outer membrane protein TolC
MSRFLGEEQLDISDDGKEIAPDTLAEDDLIEDEELMGDGKKEAAGSDEEEDTIFMGNEEEEFEIEDDSPAYLATRRKIFIEPSHRLGAKPLRLTLEDCIRIAMVNNNKVQAQEYGIDAAKAKHMEADARYWPIFEYEWMSAPIPQNVGNAVGNFFTGNIAWWNKFRVIMAMPVYAFGKLSIVKDLAAGGISAAREYKKKERISTVTQVRKLYWGVILAEELGRLVTRAHDKLTDAIDKNHKEGRAPVDKIKAKVFLVDLEKRLAETRDKELLALDALRVQMGLNPDVAVMVYGRKLRPIRTKLRPFDEYKRIALESRPDVKLVEIGLETRRKQYTLEKRNFLPGIGVGAYFDVARADRTIVGLTTTDNFSNPFNYTRAGVGMQMKGKFDVHGQAARVKKAKSEYYKASLEHYMAKDGIVLQVKKAYMDAVRAFDNVIRAEKSQKLARQLMFLTQSNHEMGIGEEEEYIDSLELVLLTRGRYFESVFNYNFSLALLDEKAGIVPIVEEGR